LNRAASTRVIFQPAREVEPGQFLSTAFEKCGFHSQDFAKTIERILHRSMDTNSKDMRELINSSLGERLE
jgi:hypothetical protein